VVANALVQGRGPNEVTDLALGEIAKVSGVNCCWLQLVDEKSSWLCNSTKTQAVARGTRIPAKTVPMGDSQNGEYPSLYEYS
jgi:hypothetical protein